MQEDEEAVDTPLLQGAYLEAERFMKSKPFIFDKQMNGKLFCDECGHEFPATLPFYIVVDEINEEIFCNPCNNKKLGIDLEAINIQRRKEINESSLPKVVVAPKEKKKKKKESNQGNLF